MELTLVEIILDTLQGGAFAVLIANVLTLFIDDTKLAKAGPFVSAVGKFLNLVALNIGSNKNADAG